MEMEKKKLSYERDGGGELIFNENNTCTPQLELCMFISTRVS